MKFKYGTRYIEGTLVNVLYLRSPALVQVSDYVQYRNDVRDFFEETQFVFTFGRWVVRIYDPQGKVIQEIVTNIYLTPRAAYTGLQKLSQKIQAAVVEGGLIEDDVESGAGYVSPFSIAADGGTGHVEIKGLFQRG
jgi:hypothetical protein